MTGRLGRGLQYICFVLLFLVVACGPPKRTLTAADIDTYGTRTYTANAATALSAVETALKADDFEIAIISPEKGFIRTKRKVVWRAAVGNQYGAQEIVSSILWEIEVKETPQGGTVVRATPHVYKNDAELSHDEEVWVMEGETSFTKRWDTLFEAVDRFM